MHQWWSRVTTKFVVRSFFVKVVKTMPNLCSGAAVLTLLLGLCSSVASCNDVDCFLKAVHRSPGDASAWKELCAAMKSEDSVEMGGAAVTYQQCLLEAVRLDPADPQTWFRIAASLHGDDVVRVGGESLSARECMDKGIHLRNPLLRHLSGEVLRGVEASIGELLGAGGGGQEDDEL